MFCSNCGTQNTNTSGFCINCGNELQTVSTEAPIQNNNEGNINSTTQNNNKVFLVLAYLGLWIVGLIARNDDPIVRFHVGQGMILTICYFALRIIAAMFSFGIAYSLGIMLETGAWIFFVALLIIGIVNAVNNKHKELPVIGKWAFYK